MNFVKTSLPNRGMYEDMKTTDGGVFIRVTLLYAFPLCFSFSWRSNTVQ